MPSSRSTSARSRASTASRRPGLPRRWGRWRAIPPFTASAAAARPWFRRLRELRDDLGRRPEWAGWPGWLSMGMSDDFEAAIEEGATHVRVGTALFGPRRTAGTGTV